MIYGNIRRTVLYNRTDRGHLGGKTEAVLMIAPFIEIRNYEAAVILYPQY